MNYKLVPFFIICGNTLTPVITGYLSLLRNNIAIFIRKSEKSEIVRIYFIIKVNIKNKESEAIKEQYQELVDGLPHCKVTQYFPNGNIGSISIDRLITSVIRNY